MREFSHSFDLTPRPSAGVLVSDLNELEPVDFPRKPTLEQIRKLEALIASGPTIDMDQHTSHHFADGLYARELFIPAGTVLTGKTHRQKHLNFLIQGDITVWTEEGMKRLQAPAVIVSDPGAKRVGYAHTDVRWVTCHASKETDLAKLEAELIVPEPALGAPALEAN